MNSISATILILSIIFGTVIANETTNRDFRCFWENAGGCTHHANYGYGNCEWFCVERECNLSQRDFCEDQGYGARRALEGGAGDTIDELEGFTAIESNIDGIDVACLSEEYKMSLVVFEGHLSLVALPVFFESPCPPLALHTSFLNEDGEYEARKNLATIGSSLAEDIQERGLFIDVFFLRELLDAYEQAEVSIGGEEWDMMGNNCSVFVQSMLMLLGHEITPQITEFVVNGLMQSENMIQKMEQAMESIQEGGARALGEKTQREMMTYVVEHNIQAFQDFMMAGTTTEEMMSDTEDSSDSTTAILSKSMFVGFILTKLFI